MGRLLSETSGWLPAVRSVAFVPFAFKNVKNSCNHNPYIQFHNPARLTPGRTEVLGYTFMSCFSSIFKEHTARPCLRMTQCR